jgi:hypothetical protein
MDWLELGIFSGRSEEAAPQAFEIEKTESEKDGSFRVYVRMTWEWPPAPKLVWTVAAIVVREGVHLVVDDIDYLTDKSGDENALSRLSEALSAGCDGPRWVGWPRPDQR